MRIVGSELAVLGGGSFLTGECLGYTVSLIPQRKKPVENTVFTRAKALLTPLMHSPGVTQIQLCSQERLSIRFDERDQPCSLSPYVSIREEFRCEVLYRLLLADVQGTKLFPREITDEGDCLRFRDLYVI